MPLLTLFALNKADIVDEEDFEVLEELYGDEFPTLRLSATRRIGHQQLKLALWQMLELVRVYTKPPGKKLDRSDPFVLSVGSTVMDLAQRIHGDVADKLSYAKVWGGKIEGQKVARDFEFRDRDIVELGT
jgi:ribosome-interacting GTPase 1